jgi:hypothetical protein
LQDPIFKGNKVPNPEMGYPGGIFDPMGFSKGNLKELQTKEIKNGRIAMVAFMGFVLQVGTQGFGLSCQAQGARVEVQGRRRDLAYSRASLVPVACCDLLFRYYILARCGLIFRCRSGVETVCSSFLQPLTYAPVCAVSRYTC